MAMFQGLLGFWYAALIAVAGGVGAFAAAMYGLDREAAAGRRVRAIKVIDTPSITVIDAVPSVEGPSKYRCLFSSVPAKSATGDPRNVVAESPTKIQRGIVNGQMVDRSPQFQLVAVAVAFVAVVASAAQVDGEGSAPQRRRSVNGAWPVKLVPQSIDGLEAELPQYMPHRDLGTQPGEVDAGHGCSSRVGWVR